MQKKLFRYTFFFLITFLIIGCEDEKKTTPKADVKAKTETVLRRTKVNVPAFDFENAYNMIQKQVDFGARVPNSKAHTQTKDWIVSTFKSYGINVIEQNYEVTAYDGTVLKSTNIIAQINPEYKERIFLSAHWDCRPMTDQDPTDKNQPVMGANDSGSGVGVILELAKKLKENPIELGVDFILFDSEDYGDSGGSRYTWCLGSQYWGKNLHKKGYKAKFGINLDMVGAENATFRKEGYSMQYVGKEMNKIWALADKMGYGKYFVNVKGNEMIDDHLFVMEFAKIPCMDIIDRRNDTHSGFVAEWHTTKDDMDAIGKETLKAVGQTMLATIYNINNNTF